MCIHSITGAIFFSSFSVRKKRQKVIQGLASPWKSRGRKPFGARDIFASLPHFLPSQERLAVRSAMLHQAKTIYISVIFCGCYSANLHFHRRDAGKLSSCPASACRRFGLCEVSVFVWNYNFHLKQPPSRLLRGVGGSVLLCSLYIGSGDWV